ncbi:DUF805 domain-containing protein [Flavobacterium sp. N3904]|uniref:DUF805 domain-containing protein n=1 Tax=Flavobacterium sp. N3904 TaxID=2986835 RepID=UPI002225A768|nr:DUF805 domain-containing protein [Flavobacterium sp. N3904]
MIEWYKKVVFENYANFSGRARRSEYWYYLLMNMIILVLATIIDSSTGMNFEPLPYGYLYVAYALATFLPGFAVAVRRLHDVGKSGWFFFIILIPLIGSIWLLVLFCQEGDSGANAYGSDPKSSFEEINEIGQTE